MWTSCKRKRKIKTDDIKILISSFMRLIDQFQKLHAFLEQQGGQPGLPALAAALKCSERNARLLLRRMEEQGWLRWEAARGRGHFSRLQMLASPQQLVLDRLSGLLVKGELEEAFASLDGEQRQQLAARLPDFLHARSSDDARNRLRIPLPRSVSELDPYDALASLEVHLVGQIFSRLTEFDRHTQRLIPALAHYWESEHDGTVWHFWLRPGIRFHDGSEMEPEDVRQTLLRLRDRSGHFQGLYQHLDTVEVGGHRRVTCRLSNTDYLWPHYLSSANASVIPRHRRADFSLMPIGSGPFKLTRRSEYRLTLTAFDDYYRERALLDEIDLWVISQAEESSEFDVHFGAASVSPDAPNSIAQMLTGCAYVVCNSTRPIFKTAARRLALANWLAPNVLIGSDNVSWRPASGLLPEWEHRVAVPRRRPAIPKHASLTIVMIRSDNLMVLINAIKDRLNAAHIELKLVALSCEDFMRLDWLDSADLVLCNEALEDNEDLGCYEWFKGQTMFRRWMPASRQQTMDDQLQAIRAMPDAEDRVTEYAAIGKCIVQEGWAIPIAHDVRHIQIESHVSGARQMPFGLVSFAELWLR